MAQLNRKTTHAKTQMSNTRAQNDNDKVFGVLQEMFHGKVDPEVVHMILTEMDWKVERAIDTLLTFCGEGNTGEKKKNRLYKMAQEILCKEENPGSTPPQVSSPSRQRSFSPNEEKLPSRLDKIADIPELVRPPEITDHAIASNSMMSAVGLERRVASPSSTASSLKSSRQTIRNAMASAYGTSQGNAGSDKKSCEPTINPMSVDDDEKEDNNFLTQSILSGALNLSSVTVSDITPLSPSKMYNPFSDSKIKEEDLHKDSYETYMERHWPDLSQSLWNKTSLKKEPVEKPTTNTFPGMYTDESSSLDRGKSPASMYEKSKKEDLKGQETRQDERGENFPRTGIGNTSLLERLGLAEKNDKGQLKNLQKDPAEDLDLNFNMDTFDLEHDDSASSEGSFLSQSGSAETMAAELKNMLGIEKREPTMLESAVKELERLNALSPNAKEFIPRSTPLEPIGSGSRSPKFLTPKATLPNLPRPHSTYAMVKQPLPQMLPGHHSPMRPVSVYPGRLPYTSQIPVRMPVNTVGVPPPPPVSVAVIRPYGPVIQPTTNMMPHRAPGPSLMAPPGLVRVSSPSPILLYPQQIVPATSPNNFYKASSPPQQVSQHMSVSYPTTPQSTQPQMYATVTANSAPALPLNARKEMSPSPERSQPPDSLAQKVKEMIGSGERIFIILRGLPGSGKSTLARELCGNGVICSADDFFLNGNIYCFDQSKLSEAHDQCRIKALSAVESGVTPVIIDNTNTQVWEMCPYVDIAKSVNPEYEIFILEPNTSWKFKARLCAEKSTHKVPYEQIKRMLDRYQRNVTVQMLISTKSNSKPVRVPQQNNDLPNTTKPAPKAKEIPPPYNPDQGEDLWENIGSIKIKNPFDALMDLEDDEAQNEESEEEDEDDRNEGPEECGKVENNHSKNVEEVPIDLKEESKKKDNETRNVNHPPPTLQTQINNNVEMDKKKENAIHPPGPLGFQIKPQKALSVPGLQKRIEKISQQKLLVSETTCPSPVTVPSDSNDIVKPKRSSRTPSFEKSETMERKYSDTIHQLVDSLISEHVMDRSLKQSDIVIAQEELKAFLHIMSLDDQQRRDAEELIDYKLGLFLQGESDQEVENVYDNPSQISESTMGVTVNDNKDDFFDLDGDRNVSNLTHSVAESNATVESIELSLENVFNGKSDAIDGDLDMEQSLKKSVVLEQSQSESENKETIDPKNKTGSNDVTQKDITTFEKEYWDRTCTLSNSDNSMTVGPCTNVRSEVIESIQGVSVDHTNSVVTLEGEGESGNFWNVENEVENKEESYWKNGAKSAEEQVKKECKSEEQNANLAESLLNGKEAELNTWDEPKSKRQKNKRERKRNGSSDQKNEERVDSKKAEETVMNSDNKENKKENAQSKKQKQKSLPPTSKEMPVVSEPSLKESSSTVHQVPKSKSEPPELSQSERNAKVESVKKDSDMTARSSSNSPVPEGGKSKKSKSKKRKGKGAKTENKDAISETALKSDNDAKSSVQNVPVDTLEKDKNGVQVGTSENSDGKLGSKEISKNKNDNKKVSLNESKMSNSPFNFIEDRSSFLVQHFIDSFDEDSKIVDTSSLLLMKKSKHELSIDSKEVKNMLETGQRPKRSECYVRANVEVIPGSDEIINGSSKNVKSEITVKALDSKHNEASINDNRKSLNNVETDQGGSAYHKNHDLKSSHNQVTDQESCCNHMDHDLKSSCNLETNQESEHIQVNGTFSTQNSTLNQMAGTNISRHVLSFPTTSEEMSSVCVSTDTSVAISGSRHQPTSHDTKTDHSGTTGSLPDEISSTGSFEKTSTQETDSKDPASPGSKKKKKSSSRRKMAAKFPDKFLDDSIKEACLNNDWKTQMPKLEGTPLPNIDAYEHKPSLTDTVERFDGNSSITSLDLKVLSLINNGNFDILNQIEYPYNIYEGRDISINHNSSNDHEKSTIPSALFHDKGTMTESMCVVGVEFLQASFPSIPEKELKDMLERCDGDVEWAVNLLLDWKYHLNLTDEDSEKFVDVMFKAQHIPKSPIIHSTLWQKSKTSAISPSSLMDLCYGIVVDQQHVDRHVLEGKLITVSEKRLKYLESQLSEVQKQYSFTSCGDEVIEDDSEFTEAFLQELINSADQCSDSQDSSHTSLIDEISSICNGDHLTQDPDEFWNVSTDVKPTVTDFAARGEPDSRVTFNLDEVDEGKITIPERQSRYVEREERSESFGEPTVMLPLKKGFTKVLYELFGKIDGIETETEDDIAIPVTLDVAKLVYTCIKTASRKGQVQLDSDQQLLKDEAYARQLQEEEDSEIFNTDHQQNLTGPVNSTPQSFSRPPQSVIGINIDKNLTSPPKVVSLQEIINEEEAKAIEKKELVETLKQSGSFSALSTKLKLQKLYDEFPGIDQTVLDDIYQANCLNLEETIKAIHGSLGYGVSSAKIVMSREAGENYEKHLIDAAKQQSLQEMLDSCLHVIHVPKSGTVQPSKAVSAPVDYEEFRGEANLHYRLRHECFQKAQEAHRRGMKQVASFYADQGHLHTQKIKDANFRASEQILATRNDLLEKNSTLDLHGLHVDEAVAALERILPSREFELQTNPLKKRHYLIVVTGKGKHSQGGISKLKPAVINYLRRNDYKFSEIHEGALRVSLKHRNIS